MSTKATKKVTCTWGLPGSGKTTFCNNNVTKHSYKRTDSVAITHDDFKRYNDNNKNFINRVNDYINSITNHILIDSLVTTNEGFVNLMKKIDLDKINEIDIQYWKPDVESCLWNDRYRRSVNSEITIKNTVIEVPNVDLIKTLYPGMKKIKINVITNNVVRKEGWKMFADKYNIHHKDGVVKSDTWSLGGTSGNCWDNELHHVSGEAPLASFKEFDDLMAEVCPNMTFLQYKKIYNNSVTTDTGSDGDYYGGSVGHAWYQYYVATLYNELMDLNLINLNEE